MNKQIWKHFAITCTALALSVFSIEANAVQATTTTPKPQTRAEAEVGAKKITGVKETPQLLAQRKAWSRTMARSQRPKKGCFTATYPETKWKEIQCETPKLVPFGPRRGVRPFTVGNGVDFAAQVTGNTTAAEGSFENVVGVTSLTGGGVANKYSLQLNTNTFSTTTCAGAANPATCQGWEQFIYSSKTLGQILIQYWLLGYNNPCPAGWMSDGAGSCFTNNAMAAPVPVQVINSANMNQMSLNGDTSDQVTLTVGATIFSAPGDNHFPDLSAGWRISEFNIFGDSSGTPSADFNAGVTMDVRTRVNSGMGAVPPTCDAVGFTFERNNLTLVSAPAMIADVNWPSIVFTQSNNAPTPVSCDNADSIGDTHLKTFAGLLYDFQASGDFVLAENGPDFIVQTRQVSGAPTWPNASINKGVATQMGKSRVAFFIEPARLLVDGQPHDLADGKDLLLPTGVQISRRGNTYTITSEDGNRVRAVDNGAWMDVHVGVGRSPKPNPRGLLGNPLGNSQALMTAGGAVLNQPVSFNDLYHGYADSWRVQANQSLFGQNATVKAGIPSGLFFTTHLNPQDRARALATCKAAGVKTQTLLDACTLDTVVLNHENAAKVFVNIARPKLVIKPVLRPAVLRETATNPTP